MYELILIFNFLQYLKKQSDINSMDIKYESRKKRKIITTQMFKIFLEHVL